METNLGVYAYEVKQGLTVLVLSNLVSWEWRITVGLYLFVINFVKTEASDDFPWEEYFSRAWFSQKQLAESKQMHTRKLRWRHRCYSETKAVSRWQLLWGLSCRKTYIVKAALSPTLDMVKLKQGPQPHFCCAKTFSFVVPFVYFFSLDFLTRVDILKNYCYEQCQRVYCLCFLLGVLWFWVLHLSL